MEDQSNELPPEVLDKVRAFDDEVSQLQGNFFIGIRTYDERGRLIRSDASVAAMQGYFQGIMEQGHDPAELSRLLSIAEEIGKHGTGPLLG